MPAGGLHWASMSLHASRRQFVKQFALGVAVSCCNGRSWSGAFVSELSAATPERPDEVSLLLSDYPALLEPKGSVRLGLHTVGQDHYPLGRHYPILINRDFRGVYHALNAECQHQSCVVEAYDEFEQGCLCPCHGSLYDADGRVLRGPVSEDRPLRKYDLVTGGDGILRLTLPGIGFAMSPVPVVAAGGKQLRLTVPTEEGVTYEVRFAPSAAGPWTPVPVALEEGAPAEQPDWIGIDGDMSIHVDLRGPSGFFRIAKVLLEV